jgi:hypothetical protein
MTRGSVPSGKTIRFGFFLNRSKTFPRNLMLAFSEERAPKEAKSAFPTSDHHPSCHILLPPEKTSRVASPVGVDWREGAFNG